MATAITIPDIGTTVDWVKLVKWLKKEGDTVRRGEALCELETDKAVSELESIAKGELLKILVDEGSEVKQAAVIAYVGASGEAVPEEETPSSPAVSPMIRNLARKHGVDLDRLKGTGPDGRITREDVLGAKDTGETEKGTALSPNQRTVGRMLGRSQAEMVPFDLVCRIDMTAANRLRGELTGADTAPPPYDVVFIYALSRMLRDFPLFMSHLAGERVVTADKVGIGFAVALSRGLFSLVVPEADTLAAEEIAVEVRKQVHRAARGKAAAGDTLDACFGISNLSAYPVQAFNAIIPPSQSAILAIGAVEDVALVRDGKIVAAPACFVTLTVDHRLINGREAGRFLARLKEVMESL